MAATQLVVHTITEANPVTPPAQDAADVANGNWVQNGSTVWLEMTNTGGAPATVSVAYGQTVDGQVVPPRQYTVAPSAQLRAGPFPFDLFGKTLMVTASAATVTLSAFQLG